MKTESEGVYEKPIIVKNKKNTERNWKKWRRKKCANLVENKTDNDIYMDFIQILNKISQPNKKRKKFAHFNVTKIIIKKIKAETETEEFHDRVYYFSCFSLEKNGQRQFVLFKYVFFLHR